jgi:hypothetical protein
MNIKETIAIINQMQADGVIGRYAIGGAVGAALYRVEVDSTDDVDVYVLLNPLPGRLLVSLDPIYEYLEARGCRLDAEGYSIVAGWKVQFLPADKPLLKEALDESVEKQVDEVPVKVFSLEHLAAIALQLGRPKDKIRLPRFLASDDFQEPRFSKILETQDLLDKWHKFKKEILD